MVAEETELGVIESYRVYKIVQRYGNASYLVCVAVSALGFLLSVFLADFYLLRFTLLIENYEIAISEFSRVCKCNYVSCNDRFAFVQTITKNYGTFLYRVFLSTLCSIKRYPSMA